MNRTPEAVALMNAVADEIEAHPEAYDQTTWVSDCGTTRCIAGWACRLAPEAEVQWKMTTDKDGNLCRWPRNGYRGTAAVLLGLEMGEYALFSAGWEPVPYMTVPEALRRFAGGADLADVSRESV